MLTNYDARSVAEVMGIAFLRSSGASSLPAAHSPSKEVDDPKPAVAYPGEFVIHVDNTLVLVVQATDDNMFAGFKQPGSRSRQNAGFERGLVSPPSSVLIEKAVEHGLPRHALRHVAQWLSGGDKAKASLLEWGVVPRTTLERREKQLSPQESERTERVARLFVHARRAFGTEAEAREFMTTPHPQLEGRTPVDAAKTDLGARRIEQILNALEYGLAL